MCIVIALTGEPEKIKFISTPCTIFLISLLLVVLYYNIENLVIKFGENKEIHIAHMDYATTYLGISLFAYEAVATLFTVRNSLQKPKKISSLVLYCYIFIGALTIIFVNIIYFTLGEGKIPENIFDLYPRHEYLFVYLLYCIFNFFLIIYLPVFPISCVEQ